MMETMGELAKRGGFQVEWHYEDIPDGWGWTDMLVGKDGSPGLYSRYDIIAGGGWIDSSGRRQLGVQFTVPYADQGIILAIKQPRIEESGTWENSFYWIKPYSKDGWGVVITMWIFPATMILILEYWGTADFGARSAYTQKGVATFKACGIDTHIEKSDKLVKFPYIARTLFRRTFLNIVGFADSFEWPSQPASRFIMAIWALMILIFIATYTANMTAFLVVQKEPVADVTGVDDFIRQGRTACLPKGWGPVQTIKAQWPNLLVAEEPANTLPRLVNEGIKESCTGGVNEDTGAACDEYGCDLFLIGQ
eukprot:gene26993-38529_t